MACLFTYGLWFFQAPGSSQASEVPEILQAWKRWPREYLSAFRERHNHNGDGKPRILKYDVVMSSVCMEVKAIVESGH